MPWTEIDHALLPDGEVMTLRRDGDAFEIRIGLYELMSSRDPASERAMAQLVTGQPVRAALIGGLGLGYTLRALLDATGPEAAITVAELVPAVVAWNRGPLAGLAGRPLEDPRVSVFQGDVAAAMTQNPAGFDVILLDVDNGPAAVMFEGNEGLYSAAGLERIRCALAPGGICCVWAADRSEDFEKALNSADFAFERREIAVAERLCHTLYVMTGEVRHRTAKMPKREVGSGACKAAQASL